MYNGIVLDNIRRDAFLAMAAKEGLICERGMTDGVFDMRTCRMPSATLAQRVLEQFTVAGTVYVDPHTYKCMDGELIEKGIIMPYKKCEIEPQGLFTFDIDTVQRMLTKRGYDITYYTTEKISDILVSGRKNLKNM